jgi:glutathione synthase/RimK-type ligase-like ATP-grasp enzyme
MMACSIDVLLLDDIAIGVEEQDLIDRLADHGVRTRWCAWPDLQPGIGGQPMRLGAETIPVPRLALVRSRAYTRALEPNLVFDGLRMLEASGVKVINSPDAIQRAHNKVLACALLAAGRVPIPPTRAVATVKEAGACLLDWQDVVFKPAMSHSKVGLARAELMERSAPDTPAGLTAHQEVQVWHLLREHRLLCAQQFVPHHDGELRVLVLNDRVVSSTRRKTLFSTIDGHVSHTGYVVDPAPEAPEALEIAQRAVRLLGVQHAAVDMLHGQDSLVVLEVNPVISMWRDLDERGLHNTSEGIAAAMADMVLAELAQG